MLVVLYPYEVPEIVAMPVAAVNTKSGLGEGSLANPMARKLQFGFGFSPLRIWIRRLFISAMNPKMLKQLSNLCFVLGFASILGSIAIWFLTGGDTAEAKAHAERFGIFVGLWAPTFLILSNRFDRYAERITG